MTSDVLFCHQCHSDFCSRFECVSGPTNGDFDATLRQFTKVHTLGSFGSSFDGNGDHASVMNQMYNRLKNNGAGIYSKEPPPDDRNNHDQNNRNYNQNDKHRDSFNNRNKKFNSYNRNANYNSNRNQRHRQQRRSNQRHRRHARSGGSGRQTLPYSYPSNSANSGNNFFSSKDPFPNIGFGSRSNSNKNSGYSSNFFKDLDASFKSSKAAYNSLYGDLDKGSSGGYGSQSGFGNQYPQNSGYSQKPGYSQKSGYSRTPYPRQRNKYTQQGYYPQQSGRYAPFYNRGKTGVANTSVNWRGAGSDSLSHRPRMQRFVRRISPF